MMDSYLALTPMFVAGTLALAGFVGCDRLLGLEHIPDPQPTPPTPQPMVDFVADPMNTGRNDFTGWVGMIIQPAANVQIASLGRWRLPMNSLSHQVKIVDADSGADVPNAIVTVVLAGLPDDAFVFTPLTTAITLTGGHSYYLMTDEATGGDNFLDYLQTTVTPTADFQVLNPVYGDPTATPAIAYSVPTPAGGNCYGPVNLTYTT